MGNRLYVGNLPYTASEVQIREFFEQAGSRQVSQIKIITDRETGRPRGFAFVEVTEPHMADSAISELHGSQFGGRTIVVNHAHQPHQKDAAAAGPRSSPNVSYSNGNGNNGNGLGRGRDRSRL